MTSQGAAYARLQKALATRNLTLVEAAAAEVHRVPLKDALEIALLMRDTETWKFEKAAVRWLGRLCHERPGLTLTELRQAADAFERLVGEPASSVRQLRGLLR